VTECSLLCGRFVPYHDQEAARNDGSGVRTRSPIACAVPDRSNRGVSVVLARLHLDDPRWLL
jgi:hypothetical protein